MDCNLPGSSIHGIVLGKSTEIKGTIKDNEQLYANELDNLKETDKFLEHTTYQD